MSRPATPTSLGRRTWRILVKELSAFGVVGALSFVLDIGSFQLLYGHLGVGAVTAKLINTVLSVTAAYFGHRHWSFSHRARTGLRREYTLFAIVNGLTLLLGLAVVWLVRYPLGQESAVILQIANIASIGLGSVLRFLCYRRWVFLEAEQPGGVAGNAPAGRVAPPLR
jgi:putative flippase GtrA